ncbi:protein ADP-ribosyltransferase PARP3 [Impatiens glandulifera]|uniref:protein ADP-ribosyltransferase PARP3 n=1 Tax=Impatiens glandulifera TaxID=253017 RepID=UPI001FB16130|nr:protein ADP-ribosyltransferase PARP3 [Impatiens glandulifera]
MTRKQKADQSKAQEDEQTSKKSKSEVNDVAAEFDNFCKATMEHLTINQMREILESNGLDASVDEDDFVVPCCQDMMFFGALDNCFICGGRIKCNNSGTYTCEGSYSEWSSCVFTSKNPLRKEDPIKLPESVQNSPVSDLIKSLQLDPKKRPKREGGTDKPFSGILISLSGRLSRTHGYWKSKIERHGGKVTNSVIGATCLVVPPTERERGGSSKLAEALERGIPVVREAWLLDSIEKQESQPLDAYDVASDLTVEGRGIPLDKMDSTQEALETLVAEIKLYGKRGVHKDSMLQEKGGVIFEKDGILYNCAFALFDFAPRVNDLCVMQLIMVPNEGLHLYFKKGRIGDDAMAEERVEQWENLGDAIEEFVRLFQELTGNEFEPWEKEKKFQKKHYKFYPLDMADGIDVRHGGLGLRQMGIAVVHSKLDPVAANFMKILCSQEIYRYALMESGLDLPDLPVGMLSDIHLKRCEEILVDFAHTLASSKETGQNLAALWADISCKWFTLLPSTRPLIFRDFHDVAEHAASALEMVRDITVASHLVGDMTGSTLDDPLFDRYKKLGCSITSLEKDSDDYKMIVKYLETTYEPFKVGDVSYGASVVNILAVDPSACLSYDEMKNLPNKYLLWCGTRSSNLVRHLQKGFHPSICCLPQPGYMFGRSIVCSDASAEAAKYGFTAVDRPEGFLVLAVASLGDEITEYGSIPGLEEVETLEEKKMGVLGLGRKKTEESEHFIWKDDIKVPCGRLVPSEHKDSPLEYNEFSVYDPKQARICFLVEVKYEEQNVVYEDQDPTSDPL